MIFNVNIMITHEFGAKLMNVFWTPCSFMLYTISRYENDDSIEFIYFPTSPTTATFGNKLVAFHEQVFSKTRFSTFLSYKSWTTLVRPVQKDILP